MKTNSVRLVLRWVIAVPMFVFSFWLDFKFLEIYFPEIDVVDPCVVDSIRHFENDPRTFFSCKGRGKGLVFTPLAKEQSFDIETGASLKLTIEVDTKNDAIREAQLGDQIAYSRTRSTPKDMGFLMRHLAWLFVSIFISKVCGIYIFRFTETNESFIRALSR